MSYLQKKLSKIDSKYLVDYILVRGGAMSHLKIQKILFYIQAYHLAYFDEPIIDDNFEAWVHGPVSRKVYNSAKDLSILHSEIQFVLDDGEEDPKKIILDILNQSQIELLNDVIDELKDLSGLQLENMTHSEYPWLNARKGFDVGERCTVIITNDIIREYYKPQIYG